MISALVRSFPSVVQRCSPLLLAGLAAAAGHAQTADPVLELLVRKGVVTRAEAEAARREADGLRQQLEVARQEAMAAREETARLRQEIQATRTDADKAFAKSFAARTGMPDWVNGYRLSGDFRGRYEAFYAGNPAAMDRDRLQYRLRAGLVIRTLDRMQVGMRIASAGDTASNPISSNQTFDNNASKKGVSVDLAYARWAALKAERWTVDLVVGKMENPLQFTAALIDPDYTPEGLGQQLTYRVDGRNELKLNLGQFSLEERATGKSDTYMAGAQVWWEAKWNDRWQSSLGLGTLGISGKDNLTVANGQMNIGEGNTRIGNLAANPPRYNFHPIVGDVGLTYTQSRFPGFPGAFPVRFLAEYFQNPSAPRDNEALSAKLTFGRAAKRRAWEAGYEYRFVEADATYEELSESDFNAFTQVPRSIGGTGAFVNGTNVRGHVVKFGYSPLNSLSLFATYWLTANIIANPAGSPSAAKRLQLDAIWRF